jgi:polar amino acid transport system permease protein
MGTPLLLQLFLIYFGLVQIGIDLPAFVAGVIGLGLHFAVYNSELIQTASSPSTGARWRPRAPWA